MARSSLTRSSSLVWPVAILLAGAGLYLWLSATPQLAGFVVAPDGTVLEGSRLPPGAGAPGDRVVAVDGAPLDSTRSFADAVRSAAGQETVDVVVARTSTPVTLTWFESTLLSDVLSEAGEGARVIAVDGETDSSWTPAALRTLRADRAGPLALTVAGAPQLTRGPVPVVRARPSVPGVAWFALTLGLLAVVLVARGERLDRRHSLDSGALLTAALGAPGLAASTELLLAAEPTLRLAILAGSCTAASGVARAATNAAGRVHLAASVWVVCAAAIPLAVGIAAPGALPATLLVASGALVAGASAAYAVSSHRLGYRVEVGAGSVAALLALGAVASAGVAPLKSTAAAMHLAAGGVLWAAALLAVAQPPGGASRGRRTEEGAGTLLRRVEPLAQDATVGLYVGYGSTWVRYARLAHRLDDQLGAVLVERELADGLSLLVAEEGTVPAPVASEDPLGDWPARLGVRFAMRVTELGAATPVVLAGVGEAGDTGQLVDLSAVADALAPFDAELIEAEAIAATVGLVLDGVGLSPAPAMSEPQSAEEAHPPQQAPHDRQGQATDGWGRYLEDATHELWPVDDPAALDAAEREALQALADTTEPVLVIGEPGVGKEFIARALHMLSARRDRRVAVCAVDHMPPSVVEVALFGAEEEPGLLTLVGEGTLVIKNLSALAAGDIQSIVGRLVESPAAVVFTERYRGRDAGVPSSVPRAVRDACGPRHIHLTPLRDRPRDVERFATYFLHRASMRHGGRVVDFTSAALRALTDEAWPLNMQELSLCIERAVVMAESEVLGERDFRRTGHAAPEPRMEAPPLEPANNWSPAERAERDRIAAALAEHGGNRTQAARSLGVTRGKLLRRIKKFGLDGTPRR